MKQPSLLWLRQTRQDGVTYFTLIGCILTVIWVIYSTLGSDEMTSDKIRSDECNEHTLSNTNSVDIFTRVDWFTAHGADYRSIGRIDRLELEQMALQCVPVDR